MNVVTRLRVSAVIAALYTLAFLLTGCTDVPAIYEAPIGTWGDQ